MRRLGMVVVLAAAALLAPSAQGVPAAGPGYVASFTVAYDSPPFPDTRYRVTATFEGEVCSNPFTELWTFVVTRQGAPDGPATTLGSFTFETENPASVTSDSWIDETGSEIASIEYLLRFTPGTPPVLTPSWETTGDIQNVVATPTQVTARAQTLPNCPAAQPPPPPPAPVPSGTASGTVLVNGDTYVSGRPIPYGSTVNVTNGRLTLRTEAGTVTVYGAGVSALFKLLRLREKGSTLVEMRLTGGNFRSCAKRSAAGLGQAKKPVRRLWANGKGKFRTKSRYASAAIRGTWWLTEDYCDRTLVRVRRGSLLVSDFVKKKQVVVRAPKRYEAVKPRR